MIRIRTAALAVLLSCFAACATPPETPPAIAPPAPAAEAEPAPPRDLLVELGDAEAAGDTARQVELAHALMADPASDEALKLNLADLLAILGDPDTALATYQAAYDAEAALPSPDFTRLIDLEARMGEIAIDAGRKDAATFHTGRAVALVNDHLGADHPRMAPLLAFAKANDLDLGQIARAGGLYTAEEADSVLRDSVDRARSDEEFAAAAAPGEPMVRELGEEADFDLVRVFYGTDRAPAPVKQIDISGRPVIDPRTYYSATRGPLETGSVMVSVPRNRNIGEVPKPSVLRFEFRPDPARHVILGDMKVFPGMDTFVNEVKLELAKSKRREIFVFIHGYNTKFSDGIERTAQLSTDLEIDGAAVFYSWPSAGSLFSYRADRSQINDEAAADLENFLLVLSEKTHAKRISVVAHSMGNEFLVKALEKLAERQPQEKLFNEIVFASPDVDAQIFSDMVKNFGPLADDLTLYASSKDLALQASRRFNGKGRRAGDSTDPVLLPDLNTIDTSAVSDGGLGHSDIFGGAFPDFQAILWLSLEPDQRCLLGRKEEGNAVAWVLGSPRTEFCDPKAFSTAVTTMRRVGVEESASVLSAEAARAESDGDAQQASLWESALKIVEWLGIAGRVVPATPPS
ncbi:MAG: alpha/beta hydrolase [Hyphomonas sp.]|uniref:alpha/beta hydrolase n=1 Tax=Hyphomonas sp. TaxID=87 RepID=UPI0035289C05